jgi:hypothetical protein
MPPVAWTVNDPPLTSTDVLVENQAIVLVKAVAKVKITVAVAETIFNLALIFLFLIFIA